MIKLAVVIPLEKTESFPTPTHQKISVVESYTSAILSQFLRVLFDGFLFRLLFLGKGEGGRQGFPQKPSMSLFLNCESE